MISASQYRRWRGKGRSYCLGLGPCSTTFSYLSINLITITFISIKARFLPIQLRGPPLNPNDINCFFYLYSSFSHRSGMNYWGSSNIYGLWNIPSQFASSKIPLGRTTPPITVSSVVYLVTSPAMTQCFLKTSRTTYSKYSIFFRFSTVMSESDLITSKIYFLNLSTISDFSNT